MKSSGLTISTMKQIMMAYELSKKGLTVDASCIWFGNFPTDVALRINFDLYGYKIRRRSSS
ncbi:unnamed protein product [Prunus brigantina]